jgi:hypothetical protein
VVEGTTLPSECEKKCKQCSISSAYNGNFSDFNKQASTTAVSRGGARLVAFLPMVVFCCRDRRDHHSGAVSRDRNLVEHFEVHELTPDALFCDGELFHALISRKRVNWIFYDIP